MRKPAITALETEDEIELFLKNNCKCLVIIDIYQHWCGCCKALAPMMEELMIEYDNSEDRLAFASLEINKLAENLFSHLSLPSYGVFISKADVTNESNRLCKTQISKETLHALLVERKSCCPLFLVMKSKQVIGILEGADSPLMRKVVHDYIPILEVVIETE